MSGVRYVVLLDLDELGEHSMNNRKASRRGNDYRGESSTWIAATTSSEPALVPPPG
jgi:hypothetical protein